MRQGHGARSVGAGITGVVGLEAGDLEVDGNAVAAVERLDGAHQLVLAGRFTGVAAGRLDVTQQRHPRRERQTGNERREQSSGPVEIAAGGGDACEPVLGHAVPGRVGEGAPV